MRDLTLHMNRSSELSGVDIQDRHGLVNTGGTAVLATPAAFMAGIAFGAATVAAYEAGRAAGEQIR
ncbi:hypothetical protein PJ985_00545 [Streptomyces sp. ACA25]|uniref:hypothetical protein n=1 Tax=Streptomyces sp. ACA25 TaxID=3022596 RepID=UPI0023078A46|nr:hypothetical protein [Streptomyces sp. ACA25]MDB1086071.1 hypothetical protein [Streptomyces sp. ACA25]